ncbi:MAG: hypothetical protein K6E34_13210 [Lachnospiraceae bacterium]|nr:hypothetical protein [Lachnospiraceae bacterium]
MDDKELMEEDELDTEEKEHEKFPEFLRGTQMTRDAKAEKEKSQRFSDESELLRGTTELEDAAAEHDSLEEDMVSLIMSKKLGFGKKGEDSAEMQELKESLMNLVFQFSKKVPDGDSEFANGVSQIMEMYKTAIGSADAYVEKITGEGKGKHSFGKRRLKLARNIQKKLMTERRLFMASARALRENPEEGKKYEWRDVLKDVRGKKIDISGKNVEIVGSGVSRIYKVQNPDQTFTYIKPEERRVDTEQDILPMVAMFRNLSPDAADFLNRIEAAGAKALSEDQDSQGTDESGEKLFMEDFYKSIKFIYSENALGAQTDKEAEAMIWAKQVGDMRTRCKGTAVGTEIWNAVGGNLKYEKLLLDLGIFLYKKGVEVQSTNTSGVEGGSVMSDRNVSTYRLAKRLGQGDVVAKSETIVMKDNFGRNIRANAMEGAEGMEFYDACKLAEKEDKKLTFQPESLMQFFSLRILDIIAGQTDRHVGNFMVKTHEDEDGKIIYIDSVKGIDNDAAFGTLTPEQVKKGQSGRLDDIVAEYAGMYVGHPIVTITYLPEDFYNNIMDYTPEEIDYDFVDMRSKSEIDAMKTRLEYVREELKRLVAEKTIKLVKNSDEMREEYGKAQKYYGGMSGTKHAFDHLGAGSVFEHVL